MSQNLGFQQTSYFINSPVFLDLEQFFQHIFQKSNTRPFDFITKWSLLYNSGHVLLVDIQWIHLVTRIAVLTHKEFSWCPYCTCRSLKLPAPDLRKDYSPKKNISLLPLLTSLFTFHLTNQCSYREHTRLHEKKVLTCLLD